MRGTARRTPARLCAMLFLLLSLWTCGIRKPKPVATVPPPPPQQGERESVITCATCPVRTVDSQASSPLRKVTMPASCKVITHGEFQLPDPQCTPGAINPTITLEVLRNPAFRTGCVRDCVTSAQKKSTLYKLYKLPKPNDNTGQEQICELDHLVPLEMGGADTLDNVWPQCGPARAGLNSRFFKQKDAVENFLVARVKDGSMELATAQKEIARDWTQFIAAAGHVTD